MEGPAIITISDQHETTPSKDINWGLPWIIIWEEISSDASKVGSINRTERQEKNLRMI